MHAIVTLQLLLIMTKLKFVIVNTGRLDRFLTISDIFYFVGGCCIDAVLLTLLLLYVRFERILRSRLSYTTMVLKGRRLCVAFRTGNVCRYFRY
jgi:FlaA1/EpsC-like NDP-sugar epimerase